MAESHVTVGRANGLCSIPILAVLPLLLVGCGSVRYVHDPDGRLKVIAANYARHEVPVPELDGSAYVEARAGVLLRHDVPSESVPDGTDQWTGSMAEVEGGLSGSLGDCGDGALRGSIGLLGMYAYEKRHLAGPVSRHHDHFESPHSDLNLGGLGLVARFGWKSAPPEVIERMVVLTGPELAMGYVPVGGLHGISFVELRFVEFRW